MHEWHGREARPIGGTDGARGEYLGTWCDPTGSSDVFISLRDPFDCGKSPASKPKGQAVTSLSLAQIHHPPLMPKERRRAFPSGSTTDDGLNSSLPGGQIIRVPFLRLAVPRCRRVKTNQRPYQVPGSALSRRSGSHLAILDPPRKPPPSSPQSAVRTPLSSQLHGGEDRVTA
ncbi:hypothetical protein DPEC_G00185690 [Dallia pectoralis]|uniref:Uncharacterized protein n=1 Tax=Dallia pectoralis TaxID=75939 RepID=A0ACC2GBR5_DALPE|nr:hypothetical protein DPEC_G00185690 [Dallia pectoralis]